MKLFGLACIVAGIVWVLAVGFMMMMESMFAVNDPTGWQPLWYAVPALIIGGLLIWKGK